MLLIVIERTRCNRCKMKYEKFQLSMENTFFFNFGSKTPEEAAQRNFSVSELVILKTQLEAPEQSALGDPAP